MRRPPRAACTRTGSLRRPSRSGCAAALLRPCLQPTPACCRVKPAAHGGDAAGVGACTARLDDRVDMGGEQGMRQQASSDMPLKQLCASGRSWAQRRASPRRCAGPRGDQAGGLGRAGHDRGPRGQEGAAAGSARSRAQLPTWPFDGMLIEVCLLRCLGLKLPRAPPAAPHAPAASLHHVQRLPASTCYQPLPGSLAHRSPTCLSC